MLLDPLCYFWEVLVLLSNIVFFTKVDKIDYRLRCEQEQWIYNFDLAGY